MRIQQYSVLDIDAVDAFMDLWVEQFASRGAFHRIQGRPVLSFLKAADFYEVYGQRGAHFLLEFIRSKLRMRLGADPYLIGILAVADSKNVLIANRLPFDAVTGYGLLPEWNGSPLQDYEELIGRRVREWYSIQKRLKVPFHPVVCAGWDATVRGARVDDLRVVKGFPWRPIVTGVTPARFGRFLDEAIRFNDECHPDLRLVFVHAWNEWTEASAVEPSDKFGGEFLAQIRARVGALQGGP